MAKPINQDNIGGQERLGNNKVNNKHFSKYVRSRKCAGEAVGECQLDIEKGGVIICGTHRAMAPRIVDFAFSKFVLQGLLLISLCSSGFFSEMYMSDPAPHCFAWVWLQSGPSWNFYFLAHFLL